MENTWIERSRQGDREAFGKIVGRYQGMVSAVTLNVVGDYAQSEDLAQETFLTVWKKLPELREPEKLAAWIYGIARRTALHWTEKQRRNPLRGAAEIDGDTAVDPRLELQRNRERHEQSLELVWSTVRSLPETLREPLLLYYRYSKSAAEIAATLDLSEDAVCQRLSRGRKMLKAEVEKQVESVLESTRPGEHFVVVVLAAIPMVATGPEVFAASSAAGSAGAATKTGGGVPLLAGFTAYLEILANAIFFPLAIFFGVVFGAWNGIRNSPTLQSRRFMLKATVFQTMTGLSIYVFLCVFGRSCRLLIALGIGESPGENFAYVFFVVSLVLVGFYCVISSYVINRFWRKIVEEDMDRSGLSLRHLRKFLYRCMAVPFIVVLPMAFFAMLMLERQGHHWWSYFEYHPLMVVVVPWFVITLILAIFYYTAERLVRDEKSLETWQPKIPNFLQVLQGEEKPKTGLRYRTNLWSDLLLVSVGLCMIQGGICANYFLPQRPMSIQGGSLAVFAVSFVAYILYAIFYAGIPRTRYFGFIYLGLFQFVLCAVFVLSIEPWLYSRLGLAIPPWHADRVVLGIALFWLACFVMTGVAGLHVFRKNLKTA